MHMDELFVICVSKHICNGLVTCSNLDGWMGGWMLAPDKMLFLIVCWLVLGFEIDA